MTGIRLGMAPMNVTIFVPTVTAAPEARTISGVITLLGVESSDGRIIEAGAIATREPLSRVKLLIDHDHAQPVGYMTALELAADKATATFYVPEGAAGDQALADAKAGLRDGLSIGAAVKAGGYFWDENDVLHYTALEVYETSLCAIPAFQDAQVEEVAAALAAHHPRKETRMNREQLAAALAAGQITQAQHDTAVTALDAIEAATRPAAPAPVAEAAAVPGQAVPAEYAAGPGAPVAPAARTEDRPPSFQTVAADIVAAAHDSNPRELVRVVNAALETVGVGNDAGQGFYGRPAWLGEIWQAETEGRPWIDAAGGTQPLTSDSVEGFVWVREDEEAAWGDEGAAPQPANVEIYAGDFAEVPTGTWKTKKVSEDSERWGFGTKVDRIYTDLGSPDLIASLFGKLGANYDRNSDARVRTKILASASSPVGSASSVLGALKGVAFDLKRIGAHLDVVRVSESLFDEFSDLTVSELPAWLANQLGFVDLRNGTARVADNLSFEVDFGLTGATLVGFDKRAFTVRESPQVRLEALDIAHGAIDLGFFAYGGTLANDARAIRKYTVA